ncbi:hypothetical protein GZL_08351 [Streptomyces sp. 769]|nr:hypothetical protein GZL_08351 [Streptomyces sp. 769]
MGRQDTLRRSRSPSHLYRAETSGTDHRSRHEGRRVRRGGVTMFHNALEPWHLLILVAVVVLVFGSKKLPDTARALGKSMRILKSETKAMKDDDASNEPRPEPGPAPGPGPGPGPRTTSGAPRRHPHRAQPAHRPHRPHRAHGRHDRPLGLSVVPTLDQLTPERATSRNRCRGELAPHRSDGDDQVLTQGRWFPVCRKR